jgi:peptidoglycan/LPS O-acetylase OafA/YrhL
MRNAELDGIRGWAAVAVAVYHCILPAGGASIVNDVLYAPLSEIHGAYNLAEKIVLTVFNGYVAVSLFFLLSGCVLMEALRRSGGPLLSVVRQFALRRLARLYPLTICAVLFMSAVFATLNHFWPHVFPIYQLPAVLTNLALFDWSVLGPTWTLQAEALAIPFIIACFLLSRIFGSPTLLLAASYGIASHIFPVLVLNVLIGGVLTTLVLPSRWMKPIVNAVIVPAHAATSVPPTTTTTTTSTTTTTTTTSTSTTGTNAPL